MTTMIEAKMGKRQCSGSGRIYDDRVHVRERNRGDLNRDWTGRVYCADCGRLVKLKPFPFGDDLQLPRHNTEA